MDPAAFSRIPPALHEVPASKETRLRAVVPVEPVRLENRNYTSQACKFGDTAGFMNGELEFAYDTQSILESWWSGNPKALLSALATPNHKFIFSDDTIFSDMTKQVLCRIDKNATTKEIVDALAGIYVTYESDPQCSKRAHGKTMQDSLWVIKNAPDSWVNNVFAFWKSGCGAAMRTMAIGEKYFRQAELQKLIELSLASSYITHTSPQGFLGGLVSALFTALAYENVPFIQWGDKLLALTRPKDGAAWVYMDTIVKRPQEKEPLYEKGWNDFIHVWNYYLHQRFTNGIMQFEHYMDTPAGRDQLHIDITAVQGEKLPGQIGATNRNGWEISSLCWPGAKGSEAPLIAYDSLMLTIHKFLADHDLLKEHPLQTITPTLFYALVKQAGARAQHQVFEDLVERACLHGGDSDSTGAIAFYWQAACLGELAIPEQYTQYLEPSIFRP